MHQVIPIKRLASLKMKLLCGAVLCLGVLYLAAAVTVAGGDGSLASKISSQKTDVSNLGVDLEQQDRADISTLRLVQVIFRHGDRTPIDRFPKDPFNSKKFWPEGWGKLTKAGKLMQYHLGQYIRKRYDGYLSKTYTSDQIYVQCSDIDRTIQSAMANLAGMWPTTNELEMQQFVPLHTIPPLMDNKIAFSKPCPRYDKLIAEVSTTPSEKSFDLENEKLYKFLSEHTGLNVTSYLNVSDIYDTLFVQACHNFTLPSWAATVFPDKLKPLSEKWLKTKTFTDEMVRLHAGPLVTDIVRNMKRVVEKPSEGELQILETLFKTPAVNFFVYSGHDTTLSPMLEALGIFEGKLPPYATSLYFELHESEEQNSDAFHVKVFYRPDIHKPAIEMPLKKRCDSNPCTFEDFFKGMTPYILDEKQWEEECQK